MKKSSPAQESPEKPQPGLVRKIMTRGLAALLPTIATFAVLAIVLTAFYKYSAEPLSIAIEWILVRTEWGAAFVASDPNLSKVMFVASGILLALILFALVGLLVHGLFGKRLFAIFEEGLLQLPVVRAIYPYAKQVVEFFSDKKKPAFHAVVAVPYPHPEIYSIAFVTSDGLKSLNDKVKGSKVSVFLPSSPMPVTGWIAFIDVDKVVQLPISVEEALRFMVSAGLILPDSEKVDLGKKSLLKPKGEPATSEKTS